MTQRTRNRGVVALESALACLLLFGLLPSAVNVAGDEPAKAKPEPAGAGFVPGSEVVLRVPELPLFDQGRVISGENNLIFTVERSDSGMLLLVTRDKQTRGWAYADEVVPVEHAIEYFARVVLNDARNADAYWVLGRLWFYQNDVHRARESESGNPATDEPPGFLPDSKPCLPAA